MSAQQQKAISTWFRDENREEGMVDEHTALWRHMAGLLPNDDFSQSQVLDFGCNRGGFLRMLYNLRPFARGIGADIAEGSLAIARERSAGMPIEFIAPQQLSKFAGSFDIAFSHEVLYLLPDLAAHAALIAQLLKRGGRYYAVTGCHTGNPLWPHWRKLIADTANVPACDYSLDDYADAFWSAGLDVEVRAFGLRDFILLKSDRRVFPSVTDGIDYYANVKTVFCVRKVG